MLKTKVFPLYHRRLLGSEESDYEEYEDTDDSPVQESYNRSSLMKFFQSNRFKFQEACASPVQDYRIRKSSPGFWRRSIQDVYLS